jgi:preprotein translocase subunit SecD
VFVVVVAIAVVLVAVLRNGGTSAATSATHATLAAASPNPKITAVASANQAAAAAAFKELHCPASGGPMVVDYGTATDYLATCGAGGGAFLLAPASFTGSDVATASSAPSVDSNGNPTGAYEVDVTLNATGAKLFATLTQQISKQYAANDGTGVLAIVVNGFVLEAPLVETPITTGSMTINALNKASAADLAELLTQYPSALQFRPAIDVR